MSLLARPLRGLASQAQIGIFVFVPQSGTPEAGFSNFCGKTISENIKRLRNKLSLTQDDLVRKSGVKHTTLTKIEGDFVQKPSVQIIAKIAKALEVSIEDLLK